MTLPTPPRPRIQLPDWSPTPEAPPTPSPPPAPAFRPFPQVAPPVAPPIAPPLAPTPPSVVPPTASGPGTPGSDLRLTWSLDDDHRATMTVANVGAVPHSFVLPRGGSVEGRREPRLHWHVYVVLSNGQSELEAGRERGALRDAVDWTWQDDVVTLVPGQSVSLPAVLPTASYEIAPSDRVRVELAYGYGGIGPERSGRADRGGMEAIRPFVLHAPALTTSARAWLAAIERHRGTPRSREPAHLAVHAVGCVEVYVDGQMRGTTPLEIDLAPGNYTQALRACGSDRARIGPLVLGPNDRAIERLSADEVARLGGP